MNEYDLMRNALSRYGLDRGAVYRAARQAGAVAATKGAPTMKKSRVTGFAAVLAAVCLGAGVCAAGYYLTAGQAAREMGESAVAQLLESPDAVTINETQTDAGYDVTLLGMVTGEHLTDAWSSYWNGDVPQNGTTYAVLSVSRSDGSSGSSVPGARLIPDSALHFSLWARKTSISVCPPGMRMRLSV